MNWADLIRDLGLWLHDLPCRRGHHKWSLFRPGRTMWWRSCSICDESDWAVQPRRALCDVEFYNDVYLPQHEGQGGHRIKPSET